MAGPVDMMTKPEGTRARLAARIIAALPLIVAGMTALAPVARSQSAPVSGSCKQGRTNEFLDLNNVRAEVGQYQWQLHDLEIPPYSGRRSGVTSGVQVGGFVNGQVRTAIGDALELWPGPLGPGATLPDPANCSKYDRVYEITYLE